MTLIMLPLVQDLDEEESEEYSLTPHMLSNLFSLDAPGSDLAGTPLSPSLVSPDRALARRLRS